MKKRLQAIGKTNKFALIIVIFCSSIQNGRKNNSIHELRHDKTNKVYKPDFFTWSRPYLGIPVETEDHSLHPREKGMTQANVDQL